MMTFIPPKKKLVELLVLPISAIIFISFSANSDIIILFFLGYIWNWSASNDLVPLFENKRYRMSLIKIVCNIQKWILKPFNRLPEMAKRIIASLPAAGFIYLLISFNSSAVPWWPTLFGSFVFEMLQFEMKMLAAYKQRKSLP
jgi:hypothetical protein